MNKILPVLLVILFIGGCTSSRKYLQKAQYDAAIHKSVKKLRKNPTKDKEIDVLREAYAKANQVDKNEYTEEREIEDGYSYKLDKKGNVMKDTSGNDIKIPRIKVITCKVIEIHQRKSSFISGTIDYYDNRSNQLIETVPVKAENFLTTTPRKLLVMKKH